MSFPPHLPPPSCTVKTHYTLQSLWKLLGFVCIALLSGVAGALIVVAWIVPVGSTLPWPYTVERGSSSRGEQEPPQTLSSQTKQRRITVYDTRRMPAISFISEKSIVGNSILLSSDGWSVMLFPSYKKGEERYWRGKDSRGALVLAEKTAFDDVSGFLYIKWAGEGYRIVPLAVIDDKNKNEAVWILDGETWTQADIDGVSERDIPAVFSAWEPTYFYGLSSRPSVGSMVVTTDGYLLGMAGDGGALIPSWIIQHHLSTILGKGTVGYSGVPWQGFFVVGREDVSRVDESHGFYIQKIANQKKADPAGVQAGDILVSVDGKIVEERTLARDILRAPDPFFVVVLRDGARLEMTGEKEIVSP